MEATISELTRPDPAAPPRSGPPGGPPEPPGSPPDRSGPGPSGVQVFTRSPTDRVVTGVAGGLGERMGVDPLLVRVGFVVLASAGGFGVVAYLLAWLASADPDETALAEPARPLAPSSQQLVALGLLLVGALVLLREIGLWFGDALTWPLGLAAGGSALIWARSDERSRARWSRLASRLPDDPVETVLGGPVSLARVAVGGLFVTAGFATFLAANVDLAAVGPGLAAMAVTTAGLGILFGPWVWRLARQLGDERRARIRSEERSEMAAHLHDSVLQTLALIQRSADSREMAGLARVQERELRGWLYGATARPDRLGAAVEAVAARIEQHHRVRIDVVVVGDDVLLDDRLRALVEACGEAMSNAARHSGADLVSVYVETEPDEVVASVSDQGNGFDLDAVPDDRLGIAESIRGRMERHGGKAMVTSEPGEGTEVELRLPRSET